MKPYPIMQDEIRQLQETEGTQRADGKKAEMNEHVRAHCHRSSKTYTDADMFDSLKRLLHQLLVIARPRHGR